MPDPTKSHLFQPGNSGGPGRPKGARTKLSELFLDAMCKDFELNGVAAIELARVADPMGYVRTIAGLLPKELTGEDGGPITLRVERVIIDPKS